MTPLSRTRSTQPEEAVRRAVAPRTPRRHAGCYWDHEQAAWVAFTLVPVPRPARD
ncbi:hypothetical protein [Geodermatophilus sp. CPCC 206100]|uniref:hypothetical protein n=1 Tax=Geodermatophilus sp. CPCC 206100 TaxID=3020054 RepID=UPI003B006447